MTQKESKRRPELASREKRFLDSLMEEMETMRNFRNNDAKPEGDLQLLDGDALQQLESSLAIDDQ